MLTVNTSGKFELITPFEAKPNVTYTVSAIREFSDLYIRGIDVYRQYYVVEGIKNGTEINGKVFEFSEEAKLKPTIITLEGNDDTVIYVPSTFVKSYPIKNDVPYSRLILSADLGMLPDSVKLEAILDDVRELIIARFGVLANVDVVRGFADRQPTPEEHQLLEQSRLGMVKNHINNYSETVRLKEALAQANETVDVMSKILIDHNLI